MKATDYVGDYTIVLIFNNDTIKYDNVMFVRYDIAEKIVYYQTVHNSTKESHILCRISAQERHIWSPNGCSNLKDPTQAIQSANCIADEADVELVRRLVYENWWKSKFSPLCAVYGEIRICPGPLRLAIEGRNPYFDYESYTAKDYLRSQTQFLDCTTGPMAKSPCSVQINMVLPAIVVNTNCSQPNGLTYNQTYSNFPYDNHQGAITDVWKVFKGNINPLQRLIFKRSSPSGIDFIMALGNTLAADGEYDITATTSVIKSSLNYGERVFLDWIETITFGVPYKLNTTSNTICYMTLTIEAVSQPTLIPPYITTVNNYSLNANPRPLYKTAVCNAAFCRLDVNNMLVYANCPDGDLRGGYVKYVYPGNPNLPVRVPKNPNLSYRFNCNGKYPKAGTFYDTAGVSRPRIDLIRQVCNFPFINPALIDANKRPNERYDQCTFLGGSTANRAQTYCKIPITALSCQLGWELAGNKCIYKFNPKTEGRYASSLDLAATVCSDLDPVSQPLIEIDELTRTWLLDWYLYLNEDLDIGAAYRVPVFGKPYCSCFISGLGLNLQCPCYDIRYASNVLIFPICFYYTSVVDREPLYADVSVSLETALLWQEGYEDGPEMGGYEAICNCYDGWEDDGCNTAGCVSKDILVTPSERNSSLVNFFYDCYRNGHGTCYNGQPRVCQCNLFWGPSAAIIPELPVLYSYRDFACACPAGVKDQGIFQINGIVYNGSAHMLPCSGIYRGSCIYQNNTKEGSCACETRENLVFGGIEAAYDGKACSCDVPIQPFDSIGKNGKIIVDTCNARGTCCPNGESTKNRLGTIYAAVCRDKATGEHVEGCVCDNGWGGPSCTCTTPFNVLEATRWLSFNNSALYYRDIGFKTVMHYVRLTNCGNQATIKVWVSDEVGKSVSSVLCPFSKQLDIYVCPVTKGYQYVVIGNVVLTDACEAEAFSELFEYCGLNGTVNPFAGAFYRIPAYLGPKKFLLPQFVGVANFGCTQTDCTCSPDFAGKNCRTGISSIRYISNDDGLVESDMFCGETISVPELSNPVGGRGYIDKDSGRCICNSISNVDLTGASGITMQYFTGKACECANMYNEDRKEILSCTGHGICQNATFPYGFCEVDYDKYRTDAIYTQFVLKKSNQVNFVGVKASRNSYFTKIPIKTPGTLFPTGVPTTTPTRTPTLKPTAQPSRNPTRPPTVRPTQRPTTGTPTTPAPTRRPTTGTPTLKPTTQTPTYSPTLLQARFFDSGIRSNGKLNGLGYIGAITTCSQVGSTKAYGCMRTTAMLQSDFPPFNWVQIGLDAGVQYNTPLYGDNGAYIGIYGDIVTGVSSMATTLVGAGVFPANASLYWTGDNTQMFPSGSCDGWVTSSAMVPGEIGDVNTLDSNLAFFYGLAGCESVLPVMCLCSSLNAPTGSPTPYVPTTKSPTSVAPIVNLYRYGPGPLLPSAIGDSAQSTQLCIDYFDANGINWSGGAASFLTYTGSTGGISRAVEALSSYIGFPTSSPVRAGATGMQIAATWNQAFTYPFGHPDAHVLTTSLRAAGVFSPTSSPVYATGARIGNPALNCIDYSTSSSGQTTYIGSVTALDRTWYSSTSGATVACNTPVEFLCVAVVPWPPTVSPTVSPSRSPSNTPTTSNPTQTPTTSSPTVRPTNDPTKNPTTAFPTILPTKNPTNPTSSPTFNALENREIQYMYRLREGETVSLYNVFYDISLSSLTTTPVNVTVSPLGTYLQPILWTDLVYRKWVPESGTTETVMLDECNPGMPSWIPGEYQLQPDGIKTCPTVNKCILTVDCTDELAPSDNVPPYSGFPDLRACYCSHDEIVYATVASLDPSSIHDLYLYDGSLGLQENVTVPADFGSVVYCNDPVARTIEDMLILKDPTYRRRCANEPIQPYDESVGYAYGLFYETNPKFPYYVEQSKWTKDNYIGVASILNNKTYFKDGEYVDPLTPQIFNDYIWIDTNSSDNIQMVTISTTVSVYQTNLIQGSPYMTLLNDIPLPILQDIITSDMENLFKTCYSGFASNKTLCNYLTWTNPSLNNVVGRPPGAFAYIPAQNQSFLSFAFTPTVDIGTSFITGIEVYTSLNERCGGIYNENGFAMGKTVEITCASTKGVYTAFQNAEFYIRLLGLNSIYDIPGATLDAQYFHSQYDTLRSSLDLGYYSGSNITFVLPYAAIYDNAVVGVPSGLVPNLKTWPQRQLVNDTITKTMNFGFRITANYSTTAAGDATSTTWQQVSNMIYGYNIYPENVPLRLTQDLYQTRPVNYTDQYDLDYLYFIWSVHLSRRYCSDKKDCQTFKLGTCLYSTDYNQRWYAVADADYDFIGKEGGCLCHNDFNQGFYDFALLCSACEHGYSPFTIQELGLIIQYNALVSRTFQDNFLPPGITDITVDDFERYYSCRYPSGYDPIPSSMAPVNFCAGHGIVSGSNSTTNTSMFIWDKNYMISCTQLLVGSNTLSLHQNTTSQFSQIYTNAAGTFSIMMIGDNTLYTLYMMQNNVFTECEYVSIRDNVFPSPFRIYVSCDGSSPIGVTCKNNNFLSINDTYAFKDMVYLDNPFLLYINTF